MDKYPFQFNKYLYFKFILVLLIIVFTILEMEEAVSKCFMLTFLVLLILLFKVLIHFAFPKDEQIDLLLLLSIIMFSFILITRNSDQFTFEYYTKFIMFSNTLVYLFVIAKIPFNEKNVKFIFVVNFVIVYIYILFYFTEPAVYNINEILTFHFSNSNLTGLWLLQSALYMFLSSYYFKKKFIKLLALFACGFMIFFIFESETRSCIIALSLFYMFSLYFTFRKNKKINSFTLIFILLLPLIIVFIYFYLVKSGHISIFQFAESEGKPLTSRYKIWQYAFAWIKESPFLGSYYGISIGRGGYHMHNTHLDIIASYGIPIFILTIIYLYRILRKINKLCKTRFQRMSELAFFTIIIMGFGESALFSGSMGMHILSCSFLYLARCDECKNNSKKLKE